MVEKLFENDDFLLSLSFRLSLMDNRQFKMRQSAVRLTEGANGQTFRHGKGHVKKKLVQPLFLFQLECRSN